MSSFQKVYELLTKSEQQDIEAAKKIIEKERLHDAIGASENRLLHLAAQRGNQEIVQFLLDSGSKVDARNDLGQTPLMMCLKSELPCKKITEILLAAGADIFARNKLEINAVEIINSFGWLKEDIERIGIYTIFMEKVNCFEFFFSLITANARIIQMLLEKNDNLSATDSHGGTIVHMIAQNRRPGVMTVLRGKSFDVDVRDRGGKTPLAYAVLVAASSSVEFLLDEGADIEATDKFKRTALYFACSKTRHFEKRECVQILLEHGANAQVEVDSIECPTVLDLILNYKSFTVGAMVLANLALQEAKGTEISRPIRSKIESNARFKNYYEQCKQQLPMKIRRSVTLFDVLTATEGKLELYLRDNELYSKVATFQTVAFFKTILQKRLPKTIIMMELRRSAAAIVSKLMEIDYDSYPCIVDEIVNYLEKKDVESLISIQI